MNVEQFHQLEDENLQLRTRLSLNSSEKVKLLNQLSDFDVYHPQSMVSHPTTLKNHSSVIIALKNELSLQKDEKSKLLNEIAQLKKTIKATKLR